MRESNKRTDDPFANDIAMVPSDVAIAWMLLSNGPIPPRGSGDISPSTGSSAAAPVFGTGLFSLGVAHDDSKATASQVQRRLRSGLVDSMGRTAN
ncbi:MAG TPA: hypothetical protein VGP07_03965 [Polyangia bacterium]